MDPAEFFNTAKDLMAGIESDLQTQTQATTSAGDEVPTQSEPTTSVGDEVQSQSLPTAATEDTQARLTISTEDKQAIIDHCTKEIDEISAIYEVAVLNGDNSFYTWPARIEMFRQIKQIVEDSTNEE